ncbi:hypothetical protein PF005_g16293 [Phytophthora fragariae]|uniref:ATPase AAA-type core domain-containing protein n=1 Tax=Phytophthora fragariae TaxID=53985 RepID=A0A6A3X7R3_9STRA|nr:hypothetical protein PF005_g16293 [Phytophthora fragariae]
MWLSSFASAADAEPLAVRARVWSDRSCSSVASCSALDDALTLVATSDVALLRRLRVVHDSFVTLQFQGRSHVGRLRLVPHTIVDASEDADADADAGVTLSPLLAFNLGIPSSAAVQLSVRAASPQELGLPVQSSTAFRRKQQEQPAPASYAMIAPLLVSSLSCRQHALLQQRDGLLDAIRAHFAAAKVLQVGDVFAVELRETTQSHVPKENERYREKYAPYKCVEVPAACMLQREGGEAAQSVTELMPPTLDLDTSLMFFRVEKLDGDNKDALALTVSDATELMQGSSTSAPSPDEATIKHFMMQSRHRGALAPFDSPLPSTTQQKLYEVLYPAQLCEIPVSVLLSGARGVGKRTLVHQVAKQLGVVTVEVPFTELTGQSELHLLENVRDQVSKAQALSPCLLYISHLFPVEKDNEEAELRIGAVLSECIRSLSQNQHSIPLIACVEDANEVPKFIRQCFLGGGNDQVFVIGATNRPDLLESGLLRPGRFDRLLYLGICNERSAQLKVLKAQTRKFTLAEDANLEAVIEHCPTNFTGADFYALSSSALAAALKDRVEALDQQLDVINAEDCYSSSPMTIRLLLNRLSPEELRVPVSQEHFMTALSQVACASSYPELPVLYLPGVRCRCSHQLIRLYDSNSESWHMVQ